MFLRNVGTQPENYMAQQTTGPQSKLINGKLKYNPDIGTANPCRYKNNRSFFK
jgi:hypothetical protein